MKNKAGTQKWIEVIYGKDGVHTIPYLTRIRLLNSNPDRLFFKSGLFLHKFHRGDWDRAFHDHPWDFWTFPLKTYYEDVLSENGNIIVRRKVKRFRWHFREATHAHMVRTDQKFPIWTLVIPGVKMPVTWGFYVTPEEYKRMAPDYIPEKPNRGNLWWLPWKKYVFDDHEALHRVDEKQVDQLFCKHCGNDIEALIEALIVNGEKRNTGYVIFQCTSCGLNGKLHASQVKPSFTNEVIDLTLENWWL